MKIAALLLVVLLASCSPFTPSNPILLIGDSIVDFFPIAELLPGADITTWGIYGAYIDTITGRAPDIIPLRPETIIVCVGINDLQRGYTVPEISASYEALIMRLRFCLPATKLVIHAILPCNDPRVSWGYFTAANAAIQGIAVQHRLSFLDATADFLDAQGKVRPELFDGTVHLTLEGYKVWADFLMRQLSRSVFHGEI